MQVITKQMEFLHHVLGCDSILIYCVAVSGVPVSLQYQYFVKLKYPGKRTRVHHHPVMLLAMILGEPI